MQTQYPHPIRIGSVPYCNAWPLIHFLPAELPGATISEWFPSDMRLRLMAHHLDLALMPVAELMNLPYGKIVGRCCIACHGDVESVKLVSRVPIEHIKTLSLDTASRSSITMCELLLRHFYDLRPVRYRLSADRPLLKCKSDAFVVIGDRALAFEPSEPWEHLYDLGGLWKEKTGLPFVFAAWIGCSERAWQSPAIPLALEAARNRGLEKIDLLLDEKQRQDARFPVSRDRTRAYLTKSIVYRLGQEEKLGLQTFFDLAVLYGLTRQRTVVEMVEPD